jgi:protein TonB
MQVPHRHRSRRAALSDAPPADFQAGAASDQWEARLMARLERYRYYPAAAPAAGHDWVRASIDREDACRRCGWSSPVANRCSTTRRRRSAARSRCRPFHELKAPQELVVPVEYYLR